jgi:hypothetical protein
LVEVDFPRFVDNFHPKMNLVLDRKELFMFWNVFHVFHSAILWVWCMSFCEITSSLMTLLVVLIYFLRYVGTSFMVMFFHQYHTCSLHHDYWLWKNKPKVFNPLRLERWFIG